jgi:hypothetical protein
VPRTRHAACTHAKASSHTLNNRCDVAHRLIMLACAHTHTQAHTHTHTPRAGCLKLRVQALPDARRAAGAVCTQALEDAAPAAAGGGVCVRAMQTTHAPASKQRHTRTRMADSCWAAPNHCRRCTMRTTQSLLVAGTHTPQTRTRTHGQRAASDKLGGPAQRSHGVPPRRAPALSPPPRHSSSGSGLAAR